MKARKLKKHEKMILQFLNDNRSEGSDSYKIVDCAYGMSDGQMGSITFCLETPLEYRKAGSCYFFDIDNKKVFCDLFVDKFNRPIELSFWKVDFSPVSRFPTKENELSIES